MVLYGRHDRLASSEHVSAFVTLVPSSQTILLAQGIRTMGCILYIHFTTILCFKLRTEYDIDFREVRLNHKLPGDPATLG